jgi:predicted nucleic-acid-binding Zn-ribbon protein
MKKINLKKMICKILGHKISNVDLIIFQIKNNPINVKNNGYSTVTCPRCKEVFDPSK